MNITITLSKEDQYLQAEILKVLLSSDKSDTPKSDESDMSDESDDTPKAAEQPTPKPYPLSSEPAPSDTTSISDESDESDKSDETPKPAEQLAPEAPALSMADLRKSVNAISRKKGLNWLYSWLGELGVKSIADIPVARLEEAHSKLQNYA